MQWNKDVFLEFLDIYKKNDCLWKIKTKDYYNKTKKKIGYERLLAKARSIDPNYTENDVKKKINNFRSSFRKEYKKVNMSVSSGEQYIPKLWYYNQLLFLKDQEELSDSEPEHENSEADLTEESSTSPESSISSKRKRTLSPVPAPQFILTPTNEELSVHYEDFFDIVGQNIALKLRQMRKDQAFIAEKLINEVVFEAQLNNLNNDAHIVIPEVIADISVTNSGD